MPDRSIVPTAKVRQRFNRQYIRAYFTLELLTHLLSLQLEVAHRQYCKWQAAPWRIAGAQRACQSFTRITEGKRRGVCGALLCCAPL